MKTFQIIFFKSLYITEEIKSVQTHVDYIVHIHEKQNVQTKHLMHKIEKESSFFNYTANDAPA